MAYLCLFYPKNRSTVVESPAKDHSQVRDRLPKLICSYCSEHKEGIVDYFQVLLLNHCPSTSAHIGGSPNCQVKLQFLLAVFAGLVFKPEFKRLDFRIIWCKRVKIKQLRLKLIWKDKRREKFLNNWKAVLVQMKNKLGIKHKCSQHFIRAVSEVQTFQKALKIRSIQTANNISVFFMGRG